MVVVQTKSESQSPTSSQICPKEAVQFSPAHPNTVMASISADSDHDLSPKSPAHQGEKGRNAQNNFPPPMSISIRQEDSTRIIEASRCFNLELNKLQNKDEKKTRSSNIGDGEKKIKSEEDNEEFSQEKKSADADIKSSENKASPSSSSSVKTDVDSPLSKDSHSNSDSINKLLICAASNCNDSLVESFYKYLVHSKKNSSEMEICLLLFVDMDKSSKLITAFEIAAEVDNGQKAIRMDNENITDNDKKSRKRKLESETSEETPPTKIEKTEEKVTTDGNPQKSGNIDIKKDVDEKNKPGLETKESKDSKVPSTPKQDESYFSAKKTKREKLLALNDLIPFFECFLTSISLCIEQKTALNHKLTTSSPHVASVTSSPRNASTSKEASTISPDATLSSSEVKGQAGCTSNTGRIVLSKEKELEIHKISVYAAEQVQDYTRKELAKTKSTVSPEKGNKRTESKDEVLISFENFGDWYNSGGFDLVPWLELLDLAKWESLGQEVLEDVVEQNALPKESSKQKDDHPEKKSPRPIKEEENSSDQHIMNNDVKVENPPPPCDNEVRGKETKATSNCKDSLPDERMLKKTETDLSRACNGKTQSNQLCPEKSEHSGRQNCKNTVMANDSISLNLGKEATPPLPDPIRQKPSKPISKPKAPSQMSSVSHSSSPPHRSPHTTYPPRSIVSFDFTSSMPDHLIRPGQPFCINITEENLFMLRNLVTHTGLSSKSPAAVCDILLRHAYRDQLKEKAFIKCVRELLPSVMNSGQFKKSELLSFSNFFTNFFACFDRDGKGVVNARELAVGFSFLCAGNKSKKLSLSFDLLDLDNKGYLSANGLTQYLRSYLTMLVGISFLSAESASEERNNVLNRRKSDMFIAVDNGAQRTQGHVFRSLGSRNYQHCKTGPSSVTFEDFAEWYTEGGYSVAPWLELLDLSKFLSLLDSKPDKNNYGPLPTSIGGSNESSSGNRKRSHLPGNFDCRIGESFHKHSHQKARYSTPSHPSDHHTNNDLKYIRDFSPYGDNALNMEPFPSQHLTPHHPASPSAFQNEALFTFPLAHEDSLIVTREDALYVRTVVSQLTLLNFEPEEVWSSLCYSVRSSASNPQSWRHSNKHGSIMVNQNSFIHAMENLIGGSGRRRIDPQNVSTLKNFFQSFDLRREDYVSLNQLMGGLTLLCGGRKSAKLSFAFGLFDSRNNGSNIPKKDDKSDVSLDRDDLYTFLRSFLIVLFSCCAQSLDLNPDKVGRYISDTSQMVCTDVIKFQWRMRRMERVNFDDFGEWYNEGGFETAPWLELLDLNKWVLLDSLGSACPSKAEHANGTKSSSYHRQQNQFSASGRNMNSSYSSRNDDRPKDHYVSSSIDNSSSRDSRTAASKRDNDPFYRASDPKMHNAMEEDIDFMMSHVPLGKENEGNFLANGSSYRNNSSPPFPGDTTQPFKRQNDSYRSTTNAPSRLPPPPLPPPPPDDPNTLKFNLLTDDKHKGYVVSIAQQRVKELRHIVVESGLHWLDTHSVCNRILERAERSSESGSSTDALHLNASNESKKMIFKKETLEGVIRNVIQCCSEGGRNGQNMSPDVQRKISDTCMLIFNAFDRDRRHIVDAHEFACGFSILCGGRKSDKLEYAFELLDEDKDGKLNRRGMFKYIRSFLTVVMGLSISSSGRTFSQGELLVTLDGEYERTKSIPDCIDEGAGWASDQVFKLDDSRDGRGSKWRSCVTFEDFADWYTRGGYGSIPWLELLDLKKWVLSQT